MIYLASPYSDESLLTMERRYHEVMRETAKLIIEGYAIFSPIVQCHEMAKTLRIPKDAEYWIEYNRKMLDAASELWVLMLNGWENSVGVRMEIEYAQEIGLEVKWVE